MSWLMPLEGQVRPVQRAGFCLLLCSPARGHRWPWDLVLVTHWASGEGRSPLRCVGGHHVAQSLPTPQS